MVPSSSDTWRAFPRLQSLLDNTTKLYAIVAVNRVRVAPISPQHVSGSNGLKSPSTQVFPKLFVQCWVRPSFTLPRIHTFPHAILPEGFGMFEILTFATGWRRLGARRLGGMACANYIV